MHQDDFDPPENKPLDPTRPEPADEGSEPEGESRGHGRRHRRHRRRHRGPEWSSLRQRYKKLLWILLAVILALVVTWAVLVHVNVPPTGGEPVQHPIG